MTNTTMTLSDALKIDHPIINDIRTRCAARGWAPTERQAALVLKIAAELTRPRGAVPAGAARQMVEGVVVKLDSKCVCWRPYGRATYRNVMTVELANGAKVWGSVPSAIDTAELHKGTRVRFEALITAGDDPSFGFFKRPTKAAIVAELVEEPGQAQANEP